MATNYRFGAGLVKPTSQIATPQLNSATQNSIGGVKRTTINRPTFNPTNLANTAGNDVRMKSAALNSFGQQQLGAQQQVAQIKTDRAAAEAQAAALEAEKARTAAAEKKWETSVEDRGAATYGNTDYTPISTGNGQRDTVVNSALGLLGTGYAWGGGGYHNRSSRGVGLGTQNVIGVDCSGLTSYAYGTIGVRLARQSDNQLATSGYKTKVSNLKPGDLIGWSRGGHVAMYLGNGWIVESPKPGGHVRRRKLGSNDYNGGVYGVHIKFKGD